MARKRLSQALKAREVSEGAEQALYPRGLHSLFETPRFELKPAFQLQRVSLRLPSQPSRSSLRLRAGDRRQLVRDGLYDGGWEKFLEELDCSAEARQERWSITYSGQRISAIGPCFKSLRI